MSISPTPSADLEEVADFLQKLIRPDAQDLLEDWQRQSIERRIATLRAHSCGDPEIQCYADRGVADEITAEYVGKLEAERDALRAEANALDGEANKLAKEVVALRAHSCGDVEQALELSAAREDLGALQREFDELRSQHEHLGGLFSKLFRANENRCAERDALRAENERLKFDAIETEGTHESILEMIQLEREADEATAERLRAALEWITKRLCVHCGGAGVARAALAPPEPEGEVQDA